MSRDLELIAKRHRVENEYYVGEALASGLVATINGIGAVVARMRGLLAPRAVSRPKRDLASG